MIRAKFYKRKYFFKNLVKLDLVQQYSLTIEEFNTVAYDLWVYIIIF